LRSAAHAQPSPPQQLALRSPARASGIVVAIFAPHAVASWRLLRRSRRESQVPWVGVVSYLLFLYLMPALLLADPRRGPELAWPLAQLEAQQAQLEKAAERTMRARLLQEERERMRTIPAGTKLTWQGLIWRAPDGSRLEGDWSPQHDRDVALTLLPAEKHPLRRVGIHAVEVREHAFRPVEVIPANEPRQTGYYETCRSRAWRGLAVCWLLAGRRAADLRQRFSEEEGRIRLMDRLPYGDFVVGAEDQGFAATCLLDRAVCEAGLAHAGRLVRVRFPIEHLQRWQVLRRGVNDLIEWASGRSLDDAPGLVWRPPQPLG
jgi:hypothetical protein